ncbi:phenol hydroxylase subunit [Paraburkholderia sp. J67]|uniref:phenol hydroxylase subunit n=1 Tax=Paraburkholderia sp. J67 TaxID=2805435 RepID=UPI002ABDA63F|nr:phenol hydroxylase subunit [Paraburkholderia sp. J67]
MNTPTPRPLQVSALERPFDVAQRYVRVKTQRPDGFVEFDFSIGDPRLWVELVMRADDYDAFCRAHAVQTLSGAEGAVLDIEELKWRYGPGFAE